MPTYSDLQNLINTMPRKMKACNQYGATEDVLFLAMMDSCYIIHSITIIAFSAQKNANITDHHLQKLREILRTRWDRIQNTNLAYTQQLALVPGNSLCFETAKLITQKKGTFALLIPTLQNYQSVAMSHIDDLKPHEFVLSDDNTHFIEIDSCFDGASEDGIFRHTSQGTNVELNEHEKNRVIEHSSSSKKLYDILKKRHLQTHHNYSLGRILRDLIAGLRSGGASQQGQEMNAGDPANLSIVEFSNQIEFLAHHKKKLHNQLMTSSQGSENVQIIWHTLSNPGDGKSVMYCVELIATKLENILDANQAALMGATYAFSDRPKARLDINKLNSDLRTCRLALQKYLEDDQPSHQSLVYTTSLEEWQSKFGIGSSFHITYLQMIPDIQAMIEVIKLWSELNHKQVIDFIGTDHLQKIFNDNIRDFIQVWVELGTKEARLKLFELTFPGLSNKSTDMQSFPNERMFETIKEILFRITRIPQSLRLEILEYLGPSLSALSISTIKELASIVLHLKPNDRTAWLSALHTHMPLKDMIAETSGLWVLTNTLEHQSWGTKKYFEGMDATLPANITNIIDDLQQVDQGEAARIFIIYCREILMKISTIEQLTALVNCFNPSVQSQGIMRRKFSRLHNIVKPCISNVITKDNIQILISTLSNDEQQNLFAIREIRDIFLTMNTHQLLLNTLSSTKGEVNQGMLLSLTANKLATSMTANDCKDGANLAKIFEATRSNSDWFMAHINIFKSNEMPTSQKRIFLANLSPSEHHFLFLETVGYQNLITTLINVTQWLAVLESLESLSDRMKLFQDCNQFVTLAQNTEDLKELAKFTTGIGLNLKNHLFDIIGAQVIHTILNTPQNLFNYLDASIGKTELLDFLGGEYLIRISANKSCRLLKHYSGLAMQTLASKLFEPDEWSIYFSQFDETIFALRSALETMKPAIRSKLLTFEATKTIQSYSDLILYLKYTSDSALGASEVDIQDIPWVIQNVHDLSCRQIGKIAESVKMRGQKNTWLEYTSQVILERLQQSIHTSKQQGRTTLLSAVQLFGPPIISKINLSVLKAMHPNYTTYQQTLEKLPPQAKIVFFNRFDNDFMESTFQDFKQIRIISSLLEEQKINVFKVIKPVFFRLLQKKSSLDPREKCIGLKISFETYDHEEIHSNLTDTDICAILPNATTLGFMFNLIPEKNYEEMLTIINDRLRHLLSSENDLLTCLRDIQPPQRFGLLHQIGADTIKNIVTSTLRWIDILNLMPSPLVADQLYSLIFPNNPSLQSRAKKVVGYYKKRSQNPNEWMSIWGRIGGYSRTEKLKSANEIFMCTLQNTSPSKEASQCLKNRGFNDGI